MLFRVRKAAGVFGSSSWKPESLGEGVGTGLRRGTAQGTAAGRGRRKARAQQQLGGGG